MLAREQIVSPVFSSIEEYLGRNTQSYYEILAEVGAGAWHPDRDARKWVRLRLRNAGYRVLVAQTLAEEISTLTASRDLAALVDAGLLIAHGERRGRHYVGSPGVRQLRERIRASRPPRDETDPFAIAHGELQLSLE